MDAVGFAQSVLNMADELAELRHECARLRAVEERFHAYLQDEREHHEQLFGSVLVALAATK